MESKKTRNAIEIILGILIGIFTITWLFGLYMRLSMGYYSYNYSKYNVEMAILTGLGIIIAVIFVRGIVEAFKAIKKKSMVHRYMYGRLSLALIVANMISLTYINEIVISMTIIAILTFITEYKLYKYSEADLKQSMMQEIEELQKKIKSQEV